MSMVEQTQLNLDTLLEDENQKVKDWEKRTKDYLQPIFLAAAKKVEQYVTDPHTICTLLTKKWPKEGRRLREFLPSDYKIASQVRVKDDTPIDSIDEFLTLVSNTLSDSHEVFDTLKDRYRESEGIQQKEFNTQLLEIFGGGSPRTLNEQIEEWKKLNIEVSHAKQEEDERTKLSTFYKVLVRIQMLHGGKSNVAKKAGLSAKWAKNGIEMDPEIQENFNKMVAYIFGEGSPEAEKLAAWFAKCLLWEEKYPNRPKPLAPFATKETKAAVRDN